MKHRFIACTAGLLGGLLIALPAVGAEEEMRTFEALDTDGNGYISAEEGKADPSLSADWSKADTNEDGQLNSAEFSAFEGVGRYSPPEESEIPEPGAAPYR